MGEQGLTPEGGGDRLARMADRRAAVEACVEAMPEQFRELVVRHRRCIELCGRAGGSGLAILEGFVYGLRDAIEVLTKGGCDG